jgi:hypothetical protein
MRVLVRAKRLAIPATIMMLTIVGMAGITVAQTSDGGVANFYGDQFQGKKAASGEVFDKNGLAAVHKKLPFGTKVKVDERRERNERRGHRQQSDGRVQPSRDRRHAPHGRGARFREERKSQGQAGSPKVRRPRQP